MIYKELIQANGPSNTNGADAYDCTPLGNEFITKTDKAVKDKLINTSTSAAGNFTDAVLSQIFDFAA